MLTGALVVAAVAAALLLALSFFVARRAVRLFLRLALAGLLLVALLAGYLAWGWYGPGSGTARPNERRRANANSRRAN